MTDCKADYRGNEKQNAYPLRGRQPEEEAADFVASEKLESETHDGIDEHINKNQLVRHD